MSDAVEEYQKLKKAAEIAITARQAGADAAFKEGSQQLFAKNPDLISFGWNQYTPAFNDGDPCNFHVNTWSMNINGSSEDDENEAGDKPAIPKKRIEKLNLICKKFVQSFVEDDMAELFGDGYEITVTTKGISKREYYD